LNIPVIDSLNSQFSFENEKGSLCIKMGEGGIPVIEIQNEQASALISLQGAQVLGWIPEDQEEVIWLSKDAIFSSGKSVRGGIPVCWPWFGAHESEASYPAHGFARTSIWQVVEARQISAGATQIVFQLDTAQLDENIQSMWPCPTTVEYRLVISNTLTMELTTFNKSNQAIKLGQALHTYFNVGDVTRTVVNGLEDTTYLDKPEGFRRKIQKGLVRIDSEVDRIYLDTATDVIIDNGKRKITIQKQGSRSTVVWNPGYEVAERMGDLGKNGYLEMLCVESANAAEDMVTITPGESHTLFVHYRIDPC
jgi:glucose-6-phosphate 1-epimerase